MLFELPGSPYCYGAPEGPQRNETHSVLSTECCCHRDSCTMHSFKLCMRLQRAITLIRKHNHELVASLPCILGHHVITHHGITVLANTLDAQTILWELHLETMSAGVREMPE